MADFGFNCPAKDGVCVSVCVSVSVCVCVYVSVCLCLCLMWYVLDLGVCCPVAFMQTINESVVQFFLLCVMQKWHFANCAFLIFLLLISLVTTSASPLLLVMLYAKLSFEFMVCTATNSVQAKLLIFNPFHAWQW